ncbi:MAG TPA: dynamin family protein [Microthrixaceae bacterium]|nr:dynamin family protein [Microthrixaceae bacterium]HMT25815.1 dynamin family protein [Microthrixaceae bacterium]
MSSRASLTELRSLLDEVAFPLDLAGTVDGSTVRRELIGQLDDYVLPRLARLDAPLLAVFGGSTGAGKSTLVNSLVGHTVTAPGVLRPTTRRPVLVCHPDDTAWFVDGEILGDLPRYHRAPSADPASGSTSGPRSSDASGVEVVAVGALPRGLAVLDAPDIDSVETANHELAAQLLGAADLWVFVTTAARYADAVPWEYLARAEQRSVALGVIVNRIPPGSEDDIAAHLTDMLDRRGLRPERLFTIAEGPLAEGRIPAVDDVRAWLTGLAQDRSERDRLVRQTLAGVLQSVPARVDRVADEVQAQASASGALASFARARYECALDAVEGELRSGELLRGEVLDHWREIVGTGEMMSRLQRGIGRARDRLAATFSGRPLPEVAVAGQLEANLEVLVARAADRASLEVVEGWSTMAGGAQALGVSARGLERSSDALGPAVKATVNEWQDAVMRLVREQAGSKVTVARTLSVGLNGVGVALMVAVFSATGGITGGEAAVAGGTAAVSQTLLTAVFGEQALRDLVKQSRDDLRRRLYVAFTPEVERFDALLAGMPSAGLAPELRRVAGVVADEAGSDPGESGR